MGNTGAKCRRSNRRIQHMTTSRLVSNTEAPRVRIRRNTSRQHIARYAQRGDSTRGARVETQRRRTSHVHPLSANTQTCASAIYMPHNPHSSAAAEGAAKSQTFDGCRLHTQIWERGRRARTIERARARPPHHMIRPIRVVTATRHVYAACRQNSLKTSHRPPHLHAHPPDTCPNVPLPSP